MEKDHQIRIEELREEIIQLVTRDREVIDIIGKRVAETVSEEIAHSIRAGRYEG